LSRSRIIFLGCLLIAGYFVYTAAVGAYRTHQLAEEKANAQQEVTALENKKKYLEAVRDYVASDAYVEQQARRQLGYVRDGEVPFVVVGPPLEESAEPTGEWWQRLFPR